MPHPAARIATILTAVAALSLATTQVVQAQAAARVKPVQFIGLGGTAFSGNDNTSTGAAFFYGTHFRKVYLNVSSTYLSEAETLNNEFHAGLVILNQNTAKSRSMFAVTGGYFMPQEGDGAFMVGLAGYSAPTSWKKITVHAMAGYMFPEVGDPIMTLRAGLGYIWQ